MHRESLAIRRAKLSEQHPDVSTSLNNVAFFLNKHGGHGEARELLEHPPFMVNPTPLEVQVAVGLDAPAPFHGQAPTESRLSAVRD